MFVSIPYLGVGELHFCLSAKAHALSGHCGAFELLRRIKSSFVPLSLTMSPCQEVNDTIPTSEKHIYAGLGRVGLTKCMGTKLIVKNWGILFFKLPLSLLCVKAVCEMCLQLGTLLGGPDALRQPQTVHTSGVLCR